MSGPGKPGLDLVGMSEWSLISDNTEDVPLVESVYLVFTRMPCERYCRRLRSLFVVFVLRMYFER